MKKGQNLAVAGAAVLVAEPVLALAHTGGAGVIAGIAAGAIAYLVADEIHQAKQTSGGTSPDVPAKTKSPENPSVGMRLLVGKSVRQEGNSYPMDELVAPRRKRTGTFLFSEVLTSFVPSLDKIYLGTLENGTMIFCHAEDLCHVALAGTTRAGKTSIQRMLVAQLCYAGASVLILNPHYSRYILDKKEDWTPFEGEDENGRPYLMYPPMECRNYDVIGHYLRQIADEVMPKRLDRFSRGEPTGKPYFLVLDELPDIVKKVPGASGYLDDILRQGAKVGIFLICASQDFLVKTLRLEGGAVRECYRTAYYVGGDATTARTLLDVSANTIDESILGKGTVMLRNWQHVKQSGIALVPLMDNKALYALLGPSTYVPGQQQAEGDDLVAYTMGASYAEEPDTEKLPAARSGQRTVRSADVRRQEREQRLRNTAPVEKRPELPTQDEVEISAQDAYAVWSAGNANVRDLAKAMGITTYQATKLYGEMVKVGLIQKKAKVVIKD